MKKSLLLFAALLLGAPPGIASAQMATGRASPCGVPMVVNPAVGTAISSLNAMGPVIYYNSYFFSSLGINGPPLFRWMQAHECAHQTNGDVVAGMMDPMGMMIINPQIELRADCVSAQTLRAAGDLQALQVAINYWAQYGAMPTGPNYPTGVQRVQALSTC